jgi:nucleotide-binding universal stress UspA family protein
MTDLQNFAELRARTTLLNETAAPVHHAVWSLSIDPESLSDENMELAEHTAQIMGAVLPNAQIHPIHILEPAGLGWDCETAHERLERLSPLAEYAINTITEHASRFLKSSQLRKPFVAECSATPLQNATRCSARKLASWARKFQSDLIVVNFYPRSTIAKMMHPQYLEMLLSESELPILVVSPQMSAPPMRISDLIFPTDFSESCKKTFEQAIAWAKQLDIPIRLFHKTGPVAAPSLSNAGLLFGGWSELIPQQLDPDIYAKQSLDWCALGESRGVTVEFTRDFTSQSTCESIERFGNTFINPLVVMSTCHGPLESGLWGSITRDVLSQSHAPVLILRG